MLKIEKYRLYTSNKIVLAIDDLTFEQGTFSYIQGHNSSGKSLFLKSLTGQYKNFKGEISFRNQRISNHQNHILLINNELPVIKNLDFVENIQLSIGKLGSTQKNRLIDMATTLGIMDSLTNKMEFISRSEKMFMYLIRAALLSPSILLIDDIDDFFDFDNFVKVYNVFSSCMKSGILIISTGKSQVENTPSYVIKTGNMTKNVV